jgi:hypothetical protein
VAEAEARLAFARGDDAGAVERAKAAVAAADAGGSYLASVGAHVILARVAHRNRDRPAAEAAFEVATSLLRRNAARSRLRDVLAEWAGLRTGWGDTEGANALYAEALARR